MDSRVAGEYDMYPIGGLKSFFGEDDEIAPISSAYSGSPVRVQGKDEMRRLEEKVERLVLVNRAMWELVREAHGFTEEQLFEKVLEIDLRDGVQDGKLKKHVATCANCGRKISPRRKKCLYCGVQNEATDAFDTV
jgi:hypothetical protein